MDLLPNKLDRLTPEQRREVEDFVDFLLFRSDNQPVAPLPVAPVPPLFSATPSALEMAPVYPAQETALSPSPASPLHDDPALPSATQDPEPIHEIGAGDDGITRDYMDYGRFDQEPSPATEAVKKVKRKLILREEHDATRHLLDWVD